MENGLCHCGCGQLAPIASRTDAKWGTVKGHPRKYIHGHNGKGKENGRWKGGQFIDRRGYLMLYMPNHPRAQQNGYINEYKIRAEKSLGKPLPHAAVVHHYTKVQLVICENNAYHIHLHQREIALKACGNPRWRKCAYCHQYDDPANLYFTKTGSAAYHNACSNEHRKNRG